MKLFLALLGLLLPLVFIHYTQGFSKNVWCYVCSLVIGVSHAYVQLSYKGENSTARFWALVFCLFASIGFASLF